MKIPTNFRVPPWNMMQTFDRRSDFVTRVGRIFE